MDRDYWQEKGRMDRDDGKPIEIDNRPPLGCWIVFGLLVGLLCSSALRIEVRLGPRSSEAVTPIASGR